MYLFIWCVCVLALYHMSGDQRTTVGVISLIQHLSYRVLIQIARLRGNCLLTNPSSYFVGHIPAWSTHWDPDITLTA